MSSSYIDLRLVYRVCTCLPERLSTSTPFVGARVSHPSQWLSGPKPAQCRYLTIRVAFLKKIGKHIQTHSTRGRYGPVGCGGPTFRAIKVDLRSLQPLNCGGLGASMSNHYYANFGAAPRPHFGNIGVKLPGASIQGPVRAIWAAGSV